MSKITRICRMLEEHYGRPEWTGRESVLDELILTILSQNTAAKNCNEAFARLRERFPTWEDVRLAPVTEIADAIRPGGLANIKAPDLSGHDGDAPQKMKAIAKVDNAIGLLLEELDFSRITLLVTGDHCTPITYGDHTGDAVPAVFYGNGVRPDETASFGERQCMRGGLGYFTGFDIMWLLTNLAGVQPKFGA